MNALKLALVGIPREVFEDLISPVIFTRIVHTFPIHTFIINSEIEESIKDVMEKNEMVSRNLCKKIYMYVSFINELSTAGSLTKKYLHQKFQPFDLNSSGEIRVSSIIPFLRDNHIKSGPKQKNSKDMFLMLILSKIRLSKV